ncbi:DUF11 domain-containing protein [Candidatus Acetothermia bacterium]|nr:DUF11 domain-containing protein [Candidatus Acetothermia bacterium]
MKYLVGMLESARSWTLLGLILIAIGTLIGTPTVNLGVAQQQFTLEVDVVSPSPTAQIQVIPPPGFGPISCPPANANNCTTQYQAGTNVTVTATSGVPVLGHNWQFAQYVAGPPVGINIGPPIIVSGCILTTNTCTFVMPASPLEVHVEIQGAQTSCIPPPSGMGAWWPLDETSGTTVTDIVNGHNGTALPGPIGAFSGPGPVTSAQWPPPPFPVGMVNNSLYFEGSRYIRVLSHSDLEPGAGDFTVDAWVIFAITPGSHLLNIAEKLASVERWQFYIQYLNGNTTGQLNFQVRGSSGGPLQGGVGVPISPQAWHHVAVTFQRGTQDVVNLYLDGVPASSNPIVLVGNVTNSMDLFIGTGDLVGREIAIDELEIFKRALKPQEIEAIFKAGSAGKCKTKPPGEATADLGDAPDSTNNFGIGMTTYTPPVPARFPTVFNSSPAGPKHLQPKAVAWLGANVTFENEADMLPDADGITNIDPPNNAADRDGADDGLAPLSTLPACGQIQLNYILSTFASAPTTQPMYVNVWLDYNRDGDWEDSFKCPLSPTATGLASEWAVQNELIPAGTLPSPRMTSVFTAANLDPGKDIWVRITLSDQPAQVPSAGGNPDGQGPPAGFKYGETEDYLWKNVGLPPTETRCDLKIEKKVQPNPLVSGQQATATITVTNVGNAPCPGPTTVTEAVPSGLTLVSASGSGWFCVGNVCTYPLPIPVGGNVSVTYTFNVTAPAGTVIQNCATVSNPNDPNAANDRDCITTPVVPGTACDLKITKTASPNPVQSGQQLTVTLVVTNVGNGPCQGITTVTDGPLPWLQVTSVAQGGSLWNCSVAPPNPGATVSCTWNASIQPVPPGPLPTINITGTVVASAGSQIQNCATVTNQNDINPANNQSCVTIQVTGGVCDREIKKTVTPNPVKSGQQVTITLIVTNVGTAACPVVAGINVADSQPIGLTFQQPVSANKPGWSCGFSGPGVIAFCTATSPLLPGSANAVTITFKAMVTAPPGSTIQNCAEVTNVGDANQANNKSCVTVSVI